MDRDRDHDRDVQRPRAVRGARADEPASEVFRKSGDTVTTTVIGTVQLLRRLQLQQLHQPCSVGRMEDGDGTE